MSAPSGPTRVCSVSWNAGWLHCCPADCCWAACACCTGKARSPTYLHTSTCLRHVLPGSPATAPDPPETGCNATSTLAKSSVKLTYAKMRSSWPPWLCGWKYWRSTRRRIRHPSAVMGGDSDAPAPTPRALLGADPLRSPATRQRCANAALSCQSNCTTRDNPVYHHL